MQNQKGQSLIEYLIIVSLVAVGSIFIIRSLGQTVQVRFANITNALQGKETNIQPTEVKTDFFKQRELHNFFKESPNNETSQ